MADTLDKHDFSRVGRTKLTLSLQISILWRRLYLRISLSTSGRQRFSRLLYLSHTITHADHYQANKLVLVFVLGSKALYWRKPNDEQHVSNGLLHAMLRIWPLFVGIFTSFILFINYIVDLCAVRNFKLPDRLFNIVVCYSRELTAVCSKLWCVSSRFWRSAMKETWKLWWTTFFLIWTSKSKLWSIQLT